MLKITLNLTFKFTYFLLSNSKQYANLKGVIPTGIHTYKRNMHIER